MKAISQELIAQKYNLRKLSRTAAIFQIQRACPKQVLIHNIKIPNLNLYIKELGLAKILPKLREQAMSTGGFRAAKKALYYSGFEHKIL